MSKFIIECPNCGKYTQASNFIFAKKKIDCSCGYTIHVKTDKMTSRECPHCGNTVIFDQSKGDKALCPVCKKKINTSEQLHNLVQFYCPSCSCRLTADKGAASYTCPLCDTAIDVQAQVEKEKVKNKGLASVIKYEGDNQTLVWKHPIEDFNLGSQLIVHESQEAIFFRDGQALDLFGAGRYTLATQNLPLLENLYKLPTNVDTPFHSEVYFINKTVQMGIRWGTDSKVNYIDPSTGIPFALGARGEFNLQVTDSRKLLLKLVGTANGMTWADINDGGNYGLKPSIAKFKALILTKVKTNLAAAIKQENINLLEIDLHLDSLSERLRDAVNVGMEEYGLHLPAFFVTGVLLPEDDPNFQRMRQQHADLYLKVQEERVRKAEAEAAQERKTVEATTAARMQVIGAQGEAEAYKLKAEAEAAEMRMKGYTYQQETARQVGVGAVQNMGGSGGAGGLGDLASLGVSLGAMGSVIGMTRDALNPMAADAAQMGQNLAGNMNDTWDCTCGVKHIASNFCPNCGSRKPQPQSGWDCECGTRNISSNFCPNCGKKKPEPPKGWSCTCGTTDIMSNFCPNCGKPKPAEPTAWDCECGTSGITSGFCPNCGKKKPENHGEE